ncbi:hypothetical protein ACHAXT_003278 [Thalassiosira profunda]
MGESEEEKESLRDEEEESSHVGDVDARASAEDPAPASSKFARRHRPLLALLGILFVVAVALAIGIAASNAEDNIASDGNVVGINEEGTEDASDVNGDLQSLEMSAVPSQMPSAQPSTAGPTLPPTEETGEGSDTASSASPPTKEPSPNDDLFGMDDFFFGDEESGCWDGFAELACCVLPIFC